MQGRKARQGRFRIRCHHAIEVRGLHRGAQAAALSHGWYPITVQVSLPSFNDILV